MPTPHRGPRRTAAEVLGASMAENRGRDSLDSNTERLRKSLKIGLSYHTHRSDRSEEGFPDRVYVGRSGLLFREHKSATGVVSPAQREWLAGINAAAGVDWDGLVEHPDGLLLPAAVWRPADWYSGRIERELHAIARPRPGATAQVEQTPDLLKCGELRAEVAARGHRCLAWGGQDLPPGLLPA